MKAAKKAEAYRNKAEKNVGREEAAKKAEADRIMAETKAAKDEERKLAESKLATAASARGNQEIIGMNLMQLVSDAAAKVDRSTMEIGWDAFNNVLKLVIKSNSKKKSRTTRRDCVGMSLFVVVWGKMWV